MREDVLRALGTWAARKLDVPEEVVDVIASAVGGGEDDA